MNPLKHGVLAQTPVIPLVEREEDWERLKLGIREYYEVVGTMEEELADIISESIWRRKRAVRFETESIAAYLEDVPEDYRRLRAGAVDSGQLTLREPQDERDELEEPHGLDRQAVAEMDRMLTARLLPGAETLEKVIRYETKVNRTMFQAIHQLLVLQAIRKGTPPPPMPSGGRRSRKMRPTETQTGSVVGLAAKRGSLVNLGGVVEEEGGEGETETEEEGVLREGRANRAERRRIERRQRKAAPFDFGSRRAQDRHRRGG